MLRWTCWWASLIAMAVHGAAQTSVLAPNGILGAGLLAPDATYATRSVVPVVGQPFSQAVRVATKKRPANNYNIQLNLGTIAPVAKDDVLHAVFWLRRVAPADGDGLTEFVFEQAGSPYTKSVERTQIEGDGRWTKFNVAFKAVAAYPAGGAQVNLRLGYPPQTVEVGGLTLTNYAKTRTFASFPDDITYPGRSPEAPWRAAAAERIRLSRMADLVVQVRDAEGHPVPGASVAVRMRRHAFGFGSAIDGGRLIGRQGGTADRQKYQGIITNWFNKAVLENDLKWPSWEAAAPAGRGTATNALRWLTDRGIAVRGHNLIWPGTNASYLMPADVAKLFRDPAALRARIDRHFDDILTATRGLCSEWDVINEPFANHEVMDVLGPDEMTRWFQRAHSLDPAAALYLNEYGNLESAGLGSAQTEDFLAKLRYLLASGAPVAGAGFQCHFQGYLPSPVRLIEQLDRFAATGLVLQATEFDVDVPDETTQADYLRDFMTALFSHPQVGGIVMWGFWAGQHWKPGAALFRQDWSMKPSAVAWSNLVFKEWWTTADRVSDADGAVRIRAFKGDHDVIVALPGGSYRATAGLVADGTVTVSVPVQPVAASITVVPGGGIEVRWDLSATGYRVETTGSLAAPVVWSAIPDWPRQVGGGWQVAIEAAVGARFFRLVRPTD